MKDLLSALSAGAFASLAGYGLKSEDKNEKIGCIAIGALGFLISGYVLLRGPKAVELPKVVPSASKGMHLQHGHLYVWGDVTSDNLVKSFRQHRNKFNALILANCSKINNNAVKAAATYAPKMTNFQIYNSPRVGDAAFVHIFSKCPNLTYVRLDGVAATRQSLQRIPGKVTALRLGGSRLTDQDVKVLAPKRHIKALHSELTKVSKEAFRPLRHLTNLTFRPRPGLTEADIFSLKLPARITFTH